MQRAQEYLQNKQELLRWLLERKVEITAHRVAGDSAAYQGKWHVLQAFRLGESKFQD